MPANPMLQEVDAAEIGKKVGVAAAKGAGKAGVVAGKGAGKAGVAMGKASKRAAVEGKAAYQKRQEEKKNVSVCWHAVAKLKVPVLAFSYLARYMLCPDANHQPDVQQRAIHRRR